MAPKSRRYDGFESALPAAERVTAVSLSDIVALGFHVRARSASQKAGFRAPLAHRSATSHRVARYLSSYPHRGKQLQRVNLRSAFGRIGDRWRRKPMRGPRARPESALAASDAEASEIIRFTKPLQRILIAIPLSRPLGGAHVDLVGAGSAPRYSLQFRLQIASRFRRDALVCLNEETRLQNAGSVATTHCSVILQMSLVRFNALCRKCGVLCRSI